MTSRIVHNNVTGISKKIVYYFYFDSQIIKSEPKRRTQALYF